MAGILFYARIPDGELRSQVSEAVENINKWFEQNPKRRVCRCELWYGKFQSIKRRDVQTQIESVVEKLIRKEQAKAAKGDKNGNETKSR